MGVRVRRPETAPGGPRFTAVSGEVTLKLQGLFLVRCPTLEPILDHDWFVRKIDEAERRRKESFVTPKQRELLLGDLS